MDKTFTQAELEQAVKTERNRCAGIVQDLPIKGDGLAPTIFWNDKCKSFAFCASTYIKSPEMEADWRSKTKAGLFS